MPTIEEIKAKKAEDRTPEEQAQLIAAERTTGTDPLKDLPWDKIFDHPRFKELVDQKNTANAEVARLKKEKDDAEAKALAEQGNWKAIAEKAQKDLEAVQSKASQVDVYEKTLKETLAAELSTIPEELRGLVPAELNTSQQLGWLSRNKATLMKPVVGDIGSGRKGGGKPEQTVKLTPEQEQLAKSFGFTPEEYAKFADGTPAEPFNQSKEK